MARRLIAENQLVGTSPRYAVFRNLYEDENGVRTSVCTSREFEVEAERRLGERYPSREVMFAKHALRQDEDC